MRSLVKVPACLVLLVAVGSADVRAASAPAEAAAPAADAPAAAAAAATSPAADAPPATATAATAPAADAPATTAPAADAPAQPAGIPAPPERFRATLMTIGGPGPTVTTVLFATVHRWSTPEERSSMVGALKRGGSKALAEEMEKYDLGFIELPGSLGRRIRLASTGMTDRGRVVRFALDRPILAPEVAAHSRTLDYPIGVLEFVLPPDGKPGEGILYGATRVGFDTEGTLVIETAPGNSAPQRLLGVTKEKPPKPKKPKKPKD